MACGLADRYVMKDGSTRVVQDPTKSRFDLSCWLRHMQSSAGGLMGSVHPSTRVAPHPSCVLLFPLLRSPSSSSFLVGNLEGGKKLLVMLSRCLKRATLEYIRLASIQRTDRVCTTVKCPTSDVVQVPFFVSSVQFSSAELSNLMSGLVYSSADAGSCHRPLSAASFG